MIRNFKKEIKKGTREEAVNGKEQKTNVKSNWRGELQGEWKKSG